MPVPAHTIALVLITFFAAIVNGGLGYGFSSITVPLALLFLSNRVLNPALVLIEVVLNAWVLWVNRDALGVVWRRVLPIVIGLLPGVVIGTMVVSRVSPAWLKLWTYLALLPLISGAGRRIPAANSVRERSVGLPFGLGLGDSLFRDNDFGAAAGRDAEQPGPRQARVPRGARVHPPGRVELHGRRVLLRRADHRPVEPASSRKSCRASSSACRSARR